MSQSQPSNPIPQHQIVPISELPFPNQLQPHHRTVLWNQSNIYQFLLYFQSHPTVSFYAGLIDGAHRKRIYYDYSSSYYNTSPTHTRFYLSQTIIIKHLFVIRCLITLVQTFETQFYLVLQQTQKTAKYTPIFTPLPANLVAQSLSSAESLFHTYNRVVLAHELGTVQDSTHLHDVLTTYELIHSLFIQFNFYQREIIFLQSLELSTYHPIGYSVITSSDSSANFSNFNSSPSQMQSSYTPLPPAIIRTASSNTTSGDYSSYQNQNQSSLQLFSTNESYSSSSIQGSSSANPAQSLCGGYYNTQELRYQSPLDKLWFLFYLSSQHQYQAQLREHLAMNPSHYEIDPTNPSTPRALLPDLLKKISSQSPFGLLSFDLDLSDYFQPQQSFTAPLDFSPSLLPVRFAVLSEPKLYQIIGLTPNTFPSHWEQQYAQFCARRHEVLSMIARNANKQPSMEELTKDSLLFPLIGSGLPLLQLLPTTCVPPFLPSLDKLKTQIEITEYNRTITTCTYQRVDPAIQHYYLHFLETAASSIPISIPAPAPTLFHSPSHREPSGSNQSSSTELTSRRNSMPSAFTTIPNSIIPPNAFFLRVVEMYGKKQPLYKHITFSTRGTPYICKLQNKSMFGGKDLKADVQNIQLLVLKHYALVEELYLRYQAILDHYTFFTVSHEHHDNDAYQNYILQSQQLRSQYCPLPTPHPASNSTQSQSQSQSQSQGSSTSPYYHGQIATALDPGLTPQGELAWANLPPSPLDIQSQRWLEKNLFMCRQEFELYHNNNFEKEQYTMLSSRIYTHTLPTIYFLIFYLKRQCFFMNEEILILQSLLDPSFLSSLQHRYADIKIEIILTDWNDRFLALHLRSKENKTKLVSSKDSKDNKDKTIHVDNNPHFFSGTALVNMKEKYGELSLKSLIISPNEEMRLQIPHSDDIIDLDKYMIEIKMLTPHQKTWLSKYYPLTWTEVDRPALPSISATRVE